MQDTQQAPERSLDQRMRALARGNAIRFYRAEWKRDMKAGRAGRSVADVLGAPTWQEESWKVFELLLAMPKVGQVKANRILQRERVSPSKTVGGLSDRQRRELLLVVAGLSSGCRGTVLA